MDKFLKYALAGLLGVLVLWFVIWNWQLPVDSLQIILIVFGLILAGVVLFVFDAMNNKNRFKKSESAFLTSFESCKNAWENLTKGDERLTYEGLTSLPKVFREGTQSMSVQAFLFTRNSNAQNKILLYWWQEKSDIIGVVYHPTAEQQLRPFDGFEPFTHQSKLGDLKQAGTQIFFGGQEQKKKLDLANEDYVDAPKDKGQ